VNGAFASLTPLQSKLAGSLRPQPQGSAVTPAALYKKQEGALLRAALLGSQHSRGIKLAWCRTRPLRSTALQLAGANAGTFMQL
jgi:hypothetical protein